MARIAKFESDHASITAVLSDSHKPRISVQQDFNLLVDKLNDLKNDAKSSIIERLELVEAYIHAL